MSTTAKDVKSLLLNSADEAEQLKLRSQIPADEYHDTILRLFVSNPFFKLTPDEAEHFRTAGDGLIHQLVAARDAASRSTAPRIAVFCMPKSGSSFVQSALTTALQKPFVSLTSAGTPATSSRFGMNSREQELDEFAIVKSALAAPRGYVAQAHTRCSQYLALQLRFYRIFPILTVRNILDCIVSFDDMMLAWRKPGSSWLNDSQFAMPLNYPDLDEQTRYDLLAKTFGVWLIGFYLSWKRCMAKNYLAPIVLKYEEDIVDPAKLVEKLTARIRMSAPQLERLQAYTSSPDRKSSRLNVGIGGRGARLAPETVAFLAGHARPFQDELTEDEIRYLIR